MCPRCGYDLSGAAALWIDSCPLDGRCPECGLTFLWANVCATHHRHLPGLFEHVRPGSGTWLWAWTTWWWAARPWVFWRRVELWHPISARRLLAWPLILLLAMHVVSALLRLSAWAPGLAHEVWRRHVLPKGWWEGMVNAWTDPFVHFRAQGPASAWTLRADWSFPQPEFFWPVLATTLAWPSMLMALPTTRRLARVQGPQVLRAAVYSFAWVVAAAAPAVMASALDVELTARNLLHLAWDSSAAWWTLRAGPAWYPVLSAWLGVWWWATLQRGWRMERGGRTWLVLAIAATLVGLVVHERGTLIAKYTLLFSGNLGRPWQTDP
jgi:hypothetical protein